ncbi:DNA-binding NarL/FixJ family response regulator [Breznakibacter xylanolyticus]|uniref:DNA-binding NarL/FixJ family response regulator n=1 Tax=Breznakibacter xylanolyticus TaxID=990 RepID=A0A2W7NAF1_9BACT|nr:response regulator transcription factor [Breznakibacter xylanolyticus]PZX17425.1 DNA-binding NarL/FixJ family response regulator [Breznakibacter xylanolyticus]
MEPIIYSIIIADDHAVVRLGLQLMLDETPDLRIVGEAVSGDDLLYQLSLRPYHMVVLDMMMPGRDTADVLKEIRATYPHLPVVIFSMNADEAFAMRMLSIGASAYINKETPTADLVGALRQVATTGRYLTPRQSQLLIEAALNRDVVAHKPHEELSDREFQVFTLLAMGARKTEIALKLNISKNTVSNHRNNILKKMGFVQNTELTRYALQHGFIR